MRKEIEKETAFTDDGEFISPKIDYAFKQMMNNKTALSSFLSAILKINIDCIEDIQYIDTHTLKEYEDDKYIVMDIRLKLKNEREIGIEMQVMNFKYWTDRVLYYNCKMLTEQVKKGEDYGKFIQCVSISILDFNIFDADEYPKYYSSYHLREDRDYRTFNKLLEFHIIELPKIPKGSLDKDDLLMWAKFINSENKEEMEIMSNENIGIREAYNELISLNNDEERRQIYNSRKKSIMDYNVQQRAAKKEGKEEGVQEGIQIGREAEKKELAKSLLDVLDIETIALKTGLTVEQINELIE